MSCADEAFEFYSGENKKLTIKLSVQDANDCKEPFDLTAASSIDVTLLAEPTDLELNLSSTPAVVVVEALKGIISIDLTPAETEVMLSGSILIKVVKASKTTIFQAVGGIKRLTLQNC